MKDYGDTCSLVGQYNSAIKYYEQLFKVLKTEMKSDGFLLALLQAKKGQNLEREGSPKNALEYYYNALKYINKCTINTQQ